MIGPFALFLLAVLATTSAGAGVETSRFNRLLNHQPDPNAERYVRLRRQQPYHHSAGISHRQIIETLGRLIRSMENKLIRHEYREVQVADFSSKTLNALTAENVQLKGKLDSLGGQVAGVEERLIAILTLVTASDQRQRSMLRQLSEGLDRLLVTSAPALGHAPDVMPPIPPELVMSLAQSSEEVGRGVKEVLRKMAQLREHQQAGVDAVTQEVVVLSTALGEHTTRMDEGQSRLLSAVLTCKEANQDNSLTDDSASCERLEGAFTGRLDELLRLQQSQNLALQRLGENSTNAFGELQAGLHYLRRRISEEGSHFNGSFASILDGLHELEQASRQGLGDLHFNLKTVLEENSEMLRMKLEALEGTVKNDHAHILGAVDDAASMADNLQTTVNDNYDLLSTEISGLHKVEQVMINTADAVLDTKRSIEFGIQQVILELGDIVNQNSRNMNSTLSHQISAISFNILKNQTMALTSMTQRMEEEISQVWRQIGIMYQKVEHSIDMLNTLQDTTDMHMNASLSTVGNMDDTVGEITNKVASVEDNLNYLLGRLSLVVSEFNHMRGGIGSELDRLRQMTEEITISNATHQDTVEYNINRKRHIDSDNPYE